MMHPLPGLSKVRFPQNFIPVEFYVSQNFSELNWNERNWIFFNSRAGKITKVSFEMSKKLLRQVLVKKKVLSSIYFLRDAKYVSTFFFLVCTGQ